MIRSIRGKLLAWFSSIVVVVILLLGVLTHFSIRHSIEKEIDQKLVGLADELTAVVVPARDGSYLIELETDQVDIYQQVGDQAPYYRIWDSARNLVDTSHPELSIPFPESIGSKNRELCREVVVRGPAMSTILLGQDMRGHVKRLRELATTLIGLGAVMLLIMFGGGWLLTAKTLAPIKRISRTASAISGSNLSERIDLTDMETELAQLSITINGAFDRIQSAIAQQTRFTADASHELKTPLSIVLVRCDLALKGERSCADFREAISTIRRAALRMNGTVEALLELARADAGEVILNRAVVDLQEVLEEVCLLYAPIFEERRISLSKSPATASILADRSLISEAIGNILVNATRYNREEGRISITQSADGGFARLAIADTGIGIPLSDQPHLFDRFYRVDKSRTHSNGRGSGLGLAITKWIVEAHGGDITFTSEEGIGTEFVLSLPLRNANEGEGKDERR